ncbi:MAG TPA: hypothetical protein VLE89_03670 [Chlamydiales bacterium]|nr:hypothetical protein [Chlamydiales bacterium]
MFESIKANFSSVAGKAYNAMPAISKRNAAIGAGVVAAGAAVYFGGPALAECVNPQAVCVETSRYFGLVKDTVCTVPTTFCQTAISSVMSGMNQLAAGALVGLKRLAVTLGVMTAISAGVSAVAYQASRTLAYTPDGFKEEATPTTAPAKTATPSEPVQAATPTEEHKEAVTAVSDRPSAAPASGTQVNLIYKKGNLKYLQFVIPREDGTLKSCQMDMTKDDAQYKQMYGALFVTEILNKLFDVMASGQKLGSIQIDAKPKRLANTRPAVE